MGFCDVLLYINGIFCYVAGYSALSVTFGDSSPRGGAKAYLRTHIGTFLPLPSGEVAMPQALADTRPQAGVHSAPCRRQV